MVTIKPIILASQSPRRKQLLEWAEVPFEVVVSETPEDYPASITEEEVAIYIATDKALTVKKLLESKGRYNNQPILAADTIVVLDKSIIGKPIDRSDAIHILSALSGKTHKVITGVHIINSEKSMSFADTTEVDFHELSTGQIEFYVDKFKPYDKAGAYAIQEWIGVTGIKSIRGDFYNVMGLPVSRVVKILSEF